MPYSDEPRIIKERMIGPRHWLVGGLALLFFILFGGSLLWQWNHHRVRDHLPRGDHGGFVYSLPERDWDVEILRAPMPVEPEVDQLYVCVSRRGHSHDHIAGLTVQTRLQDGLWMDLPWDYEHQLYGPAPELELPYNRDRKVNLRILEDGHVVWHSRIWAYSIYLAQRGGGHSHGHGHSH